MSDRPGLCAACNHARTIENRRGSLFWLCGLSQTDPRFARYPRLPVYECQGFSPSRRDVAPANTTTGEDHE